MPRRFAVATTTTPTTTPTRTPRTALLALGVALGLAALAPDARPQEPEALARRLRDATTRAARALAAAHARLVDAHAGAPRGPGGPGPFAGPRGPIGPGGPGGPPGGGPAPVQGEPELRPLVALTLLRAGGPAERPLAEKLLDSWWADAEAGKVALESSSNYQLALAISALEGTALARVDDGALTTRSKYEATPLTPANLKRLEIAVRALVEGRSLTGLDQSGCAWTYHMAPFRSSGGDTVDRDATHLRSFDNSNTQFSVLALHDAARAGVKVGRELADAVATHFLECAGTPGEDDAPFHRPRGPTERETGRREPRESTGSSTAPLRWGYTFCGRAPSPSMTFAGLSSLAVARELGAKKERLDDVLRRSLVGLDKMVLVSGRANEGYTLYSIEKALDLLEVDKLAGRDWFEPLAESLLQTQLPTGLWGEGGSDDCFITLFLARATVATSRVVDRRSTGGGAPATHGEVYLAARKKSVDVVALLDAYGDAQGAPAGSAHEAAGEALQALVAEGHGHDACLYAPLARLLAKGGTKREAAASWLRELNGREPTPADAAAAGERFVQLAQARDARATTALRAALGEPTLPLPLRAFCSNALGELACAEAAPDVTAALERLAADEKLLGTGAGARTARALGDALVGLARVPVPALEPKGPLAPAALLALVEAVRSGERRALDESVEKALATHAAREADAAAWKRARTDLASRGRPAFARLVELGASGPRSAEAYSVLRAVTGELIPDDADAWKAWLESVK